jgi:hypothetical protein
LTSNTENTRKYNNVYYIDLILTDLAGNLKIETRTIHIVNLSPYVVGENGTTEIVSYAMNAGETFTYPEITAYSLDKYFIGVVEEIDTYEYIVEYEGRLVDKVDSNIAGNYDIYVRVVDQSGRVSVQKVMNLFIQSEFTNPIVNNNSNAVKYAVIAAVMTGIVAVLGLAFVSMKKRNINR